MKMETPLYERTRQVRSGRAAALVRSYLVPLLVTLFLISVITFLATNALGIDVARNVLGRQATPSELQSFRHQHGLDKPLVVRYGTWLGDFVQGDWGVSALTGRSVRSALQPAFIYTLILALGSLALALPLSLALGIYMAKRARTTRDLLLSIGTVAVAAAPIFVIGIVLILVIAVKLAWLPVDSSSLTFPGLLQKVEAYALPTVTLAVSLVPHFTRMTRAAFRETLTTPYAQAAVLRGLPPPLITWRHLFPNAAAPIVNVIALETMWLLGGVIVVENVFGFPGMGSLLVASIQGGDLISVQAIAMLTGSLFIGLNLVADALVVLFNPKLRGVAA